jgi:general secretion pathway protein G
MTVQARSGFTLIELVVAIAILAVLAAIVGPAIMNKIDNARKSATLSNLKTLKTAIDTFKSGTGRYPAKLHDLVEKPKEEAVARNWQKGGYIEGGELPQDSWHEDFQYKRTPEAKNPYELYSYGPNGAGAPKDEWISVWNR